MEGGEGSSEHLPQEAAPAGGLVSYFANPNGERSEENKTVAERRVSDKYCTNARKRASSMVNVREKGCERPL